MGVVKREGRWRLEKKKEGVYQVTKRGELEAKIITGEYEPEGPFSDERGGMMVDSIEVKDFNQAKQEFQTFVKGNRGGFL
jgi:hypothetical protein